MWLKFLIPYALLICTVDIIFKVVARWDIHLLYFTCQAMIFGSFTLLAISKPGPLSLSTLRSAGTWIYGILFLIGNVLFMTSLTKLDIVTVELLTCSCIIMSYILVYLFLGRNKFTYLRSLMMLTILISIGFIVADIPRENQIFAIFITIAIGIVTSLRAMTQETHNTSNQTKGSVSNECRVTGFTLGVTALIIGSSLALIGTLNPYLDLPLLQGFAPTIEQMLSLESFLFAAIYGVTMLSALRYMEFYWIKKIKAERFTIIITVLPVLAFVFEYYADKIGLVEFTGLTIMQAVFGGLAVMAAAIIEISEARAARNQVNKISQLSKKEIEQIDIDHQIASLTLQTAGDDKKKAAKMLEIGVKVLDKALEAPNTGNALSNEMSYRLRTSFSNNVAMIDALTGLMNKTQFYSIFQSVLRRGDQGILLYIDLNKFKPVNDTFGHNAGDEVLKVIASRMKANTGRNSIHARLGGDEFAILLTNTNTAKGEKIRDRLNSKIAEPIKIDGIDEALCVGASTGIALFPKNGNSVEELIHIADQAMYREKNR